MDLRPSLRRRTALVTGAASGIGRAFATALAARGDRLVLVDVDEAALAVVALDLGGDHDVQVVDLASATAIERLRDNLAAHEPCIDLLIHCAGILGAGAFADQPVADFARVLQVNLLGTVHVTHACLPQLTRARGHVVALASTASLHGWPLLGAYSAAKGAVENWAEAVRPELRRRGVGLTTVFPLLVDTPMLARAGTPPILRGRRVSADDVVTRALRAVDRGRARLFVPALARLVAITHGVAPPLLDWWGARRGFTSTTRSNA
ncbi:MAG: SDR family NAD(P)-dependent oxidoreductase [Deltaproteobacteria bacterium]|nr:SDR family NAD(P)-dependent oxidoreductase [Deltaproteobacteria bacterium]